MAKLRRPDDDTFQQRYTKLRIVALRGVKLLLDVDRLDTQQKLANSAGRSATWPDALRLTPFVHDCLSMFEAPAS